jgi:NAD(P)H-hydrate epimerase
VLVVGGSEGMAGAPALAARGALRAGAGLVVVAAPRAIVAITASFQAEAMVVPVPSERPEALDASSLPAIEALLARADAVVVGPGLARAAGTEVLVRRLLFAPCALVLDADGLHAVHGRLADLAARRAPTVLTPHEGEAAGLLGTHVDAVAAAREDAARRIAREARAVCVLKGPATVVTDGTRLSVNGTGGPVLATGGTGDVLAGVIGALLAGLSGSGVDALGAAALGVHVHGRAADRLASRRGDRGTLASEVADEIPSVLLELRRPEPRP